MGGPGPVKMKDSTAPRSRSCLSRYLLSKWCCCCGIPLEGLSVRSMLFCMSAFGGIVHGMVLAMVLSWGLSGQDYDYINRDHTMAHVVYAFWAFVCCACGWFGAVGYSARLASLYLAHFASTSALSIYQAFQMYQQVSAVCHKWG